MPNISTKTFDNLVSDQVNAIQSSANRSGIKMVVDTTVGSIFRAIVEANSAVALWFQGILLQLLTTTRAATSSGADLDSWAADYSFYRIPAVPATGQVTFFRYTSVGAPGAFIPVGAQIQTSDTTREVFSVVAGSTGMTGWSPWLNGYSLDAGAPSISVPVQCNTAGTVGNIQKNQCNVLTGSMPGIDGVTNASDFTNGVDAETDTAFRTRFASYLVSLSKATKNAVSAAVTGVQQGLNFTLTENVNYGGTPTPGYFYVVVDDGSGTPSSGLLASVNNAIDAVRGFTTTFGVFAPQLQFANVTLTITSSGTNRAGDAALAQAAISGYIGGLGVGVSLPYSKLAQLAYDASPTITNVTLVTLNGLAADLVANNKQRIIGTVSAGHFVIGATYTIAYVGTTDFTTLGASSNTVGLVFTATGSGSTSTTGTVSTVVVHY